jgi:polyhydroxyalkanoate synthase
MMQMHMKRGRSIHDPLAAAYLAGQRTYRAGLIALVNARRRSLGKSPLDWPKVGATPHEVVWREGGATLIRYRAENDASASKPAGLPLLLICSLINRPYVLDLLAERSVVGRLLASGRDVWLLDWGKTEPADATRSLGSYALELLPRAAEVVRLRAHAERLHLLGYCMGGTFALLAAAAGKIPVAGLVAMAAPVDLDDGGMLSMWCRAPGFDPAEIVRVYGNAPPHLLQPAFKLLDPVGLATKLAHLDEKLGDDDFVRFFLAMETWLEDSVAFPGRAFTEWVSLYRDNALVRGTCRLDGERIDLGRLEGPVMTLVADGDYITPPQSSLALERLSPGAQHETVRMKGGHIGLSTSSAAHRELWPKVAAWLSTHDNMMQTHQKRTPRVMRAHKKGRAKR